MAGLKGEDGIVAGCVTTACWQEELRVPGSGRRACSKPQRRPKFSGSIDLALETSHSLANKLFTNANDPVSTFT